MNPEAETFEPIVRYRRRTLTFGSGLVASSYLIDLALGHGAPTLAARAGWIAAILAVAAAQRPEWPRLAEGAALAGAAASGLFVVLIVGLTGGSESIYAGMLLVTPYAVLIALADLPWAAALSGLLCVAGGVAIRLGEGQGARAIASWVVLSTVMSALAAWGAAASRRIWVAEAESERARLQALAELAESERRRAEAERLAEVGRLAAAVAHEVNNPLSVVKANVSWLAGAEAAGDDGAERSAVVAETLESVQRISRIVLDLRSAAGGRKPPPPKR